MKDSEIRHDVQRALDRDSGLDASGIAVAVDEAVATLHGEVKSDFEKHEAQRVALRVYGVTAVANELVVLPGRHDPNDTEIAHAVVDALTWDALVPLHRVHVVVARQWVTLSGTLQWEYQRTSAARTAAKVLGVKGVSNAIVLATPMGQACAVNCLPSGRRAVPPCGDWSGLPRHEA
jgi:osmotically-inducible protein OsmY